MGKHHAQPEIPCALYHHVSITKKRMEKLSTRERQMAFQNWVAYIRTNSSDVPQEKRFVCPLRDCDESYNDLEPMLKHVAACPKLDAGEYMCPHCSQYEMYDASRPTSQQGSLKRTGSKFKRAMIFFRQLGLKGCPWTCSHATSSPKSNEIYEETLKEPPTTTSITTQELDSRLRFELASELELPAGDVFLSEASVEDAGAPLGGLEAVPDSRQFHVTSATSKYVYGPDDFQCISTPWLDVNSRAHSIDSIDSAVTGWQSSSPLTRQSSSHMPMGVDLSIADPAELESLLKRRRPAFSCSDGVHELPANQASLKMTLAAVPVNRQRSGATHAGPLLVRTKVEELGHLFEILHDEWTRRQSFIPELLQASSQLPVDTLFHMGLQALADVIKERLPETFAATFALMHVAASCAFMVYGGHHMPSWYDLLQDCMEWRHAMSDHDERKVFVQAMVQVIDASQDTCKGPRCKESIPVLSRSTCSFIKPAFHHPLCDGDTTSQQLDATCQPLQGTRGVESLLERLKRGRPFKACLDFLDDIARTEVLGRIPFKPARYIEQHEGGIPDMNRLIIRRLKQRSEFNIMGNGINDVERHIMTGQLWSPREVELALLSCCETIRMDASAYRTCRSTITLVCNHSMTEVGPKWRDSHYSIDVGRVMAIASHAAFCSVPLPTYEEVVAAEPDIHKFGPLLDSHGHIALPATTSEMASFSLGSASHNRAIATPPPDYAESIYATFPDKNNTQIALDGFPPSPPSSHTSPRPAISTSLCPFCKQSITTTNLGRHIRTVHQGTRREDIPCRVSTCKSTFSRTRPDNLVKHMRVVHGEISLKRHGATKRGKFS